MSAWKDGTEGVKVRNQIKIIEVVDNNDTRTTALTNF